MFKDKIDGSEDADTCRRKRVVEIYTERMTGWTQGLRSKRHKWRQLNWNSAPWLASRTQLGSHIQERAAASNHAVPSVLAKICDY